MKSKVLFVVSLLMTLFMTTASADMELTIEDMELFANARFGPADGKTRYWYGAGPVRDVATGEIIYSFEYYDAVRHLVDPENPNRHIGIVRKFDLFRDKDTNELLELFNGNPVKSAIYPYQLFELEFNNGAIELSATQGSGEFVRTHTFKEMLVEKFGNSSHISIPAHFKTTSTELPDFVQTFAMTALYITCQKDCGAEPHNQWVQADVTPMLPWAGGDGKKMSYMFMTGVRYDNFSELPKHLRDLIDTDYPEWRNPAKNLKEVELLQR